MGAAVAATPGTELLERSDPDAPRFEGWRVRLAPVTPNDHRYLYELAAAREISYRWRFRNHLPRFEAFVQSLDTDVLTQFVVRHLPDDEPLGHVICYGPDLVNRHAYVAGIVDPSVAGLHMGAEALSLLIDHLFTA